MTTLASRPAAVAQSGTQWQLLARAPSPIFKAENMLRLCDEKEGALSNDEGKTGDFTHPAGPSSDLSASLSR